MSLWSELTRTTFVSSGRVVAHILDPITGYSNRDLQVGKDIDAETVRRLGDNGAVFIVVAYEGGTPTATVCKRARWASSPGAATRRRPGRRRDGLGQAART